MNYEKIKKEVISPCGPGAESLGKPLQLSEQSLGSKRISQHLVRVQVQQSIALLYQNLKPLRHDHPEQERGRRFPGIPHPIRGSVGMDNDSQGPARCPGDVENVC